jgi:hypothetical protein
MYTLQGKTRPTRHTLSTLGPRMTLDQMYLMWSTYSNLSQNHQQRWTDTTALEKKCSRLHLLARLSGSRDPPQFLSQPSHWSSRLKTSICWWQATRLTGSISPSCDRYVQYLLAGVNPSVLNRHSRGLQPWRCWLATSHSPTFPTDGLHFSPKGPVRSPV